jgi:branched-chain amino acid transport system ATP-binding protein
MQPSTAALEVRTVTAGYLPGIDILHGVSMHVDPHEIVGIIGPNGAGKSTLLKAVFGLVRVRDGEILLRGEAITNQPPHQLVARGVGFVPQLANVFTPLTVRENLRMGVFLAPDAFDERWAELRALFPRLVERFDARAGSLSGGERQMLAMARALMMRPGVLCLDEPSAGLSPRVQAEVFALVREVNRSGVAVLMVEQNARRCLAIAHRGYVLDQGKDAVTGTGEHLLHDPTVIELYLGRLGERAAPPGGSHDAIRPPEPSPPQ